MTAFKTGKSERQFFLAQAVLSQLFVLKCCTLLIALFASIDTLQPDNWHAVF